MSLFWLIVAGCLIRYLFVGRKKNIFKTFPIKTSELSSEHLRELTNEELELLRPYTEDPSLVIPYKLQTELVDKKVYYLEGDYICHGLDDETCQDTYYTIGDFKVIFPYNLRDYATEWSRAQVVFTPEYALVIVIDNVTMAKAIAHQPMIIPQQTQSDELAVLNHLIDSNTSSSKSALLYSLIKGKLLDDDLGNIGKQRDETEAEQRLANKRNTGFLASVCLAVATASTIAYVQSTIDILSSILLIITVIALLLVIWLYFKKVNGTEKTISQIKAVITTIDPTANQFSLRGVSSIQYPPYWHDYIIKNSSAEVDIDICRESYQPTKLVRFGRALSIDQEVKSFGLINYWGRNCYLMIIGCILTLIAYCYFTPLMPGYRYTYNLLSDQAVPLIVTDQQKLRLLSLKYGDWVDIQMKGHCDPHNIIRCNPIQLTTGEIDVSTVDKTLLELPDLIVMRQDNDLLKTIRDDEVLLYERLIETKNSDDYADENQSIYVRMTNIENILLMLNETCQSTANQILRSCHALQDELLSALDINNLDLTDWLSIYHAVLAKENHNSLFIRKDTANRLNWLLDDIVVNYLNVKIASQYHLIDVAQQSMAGSMLIDVKAQSVTRYVDYPIQKQRLLDNALPDIAQFNYNKRLIANQADLPFRVQGMVTKISLDPQGRNSYIAIDSDLSAQRVAGWMTPFAISSLMFSLLIVFTLSQLIIMLTKMVRNKRRIEKITEYYRNRLI